MYYKALRDIVLGGLCDAAFKPVTKPRPAEPAKLGGAGCRKGEGRTFNARFECVCKHEG